MEKKLCASVLDTIGNTPLEAFSEMHHENGQGCCA